MANDLRQCMMKCHYADFLDNRLCGYLGTLSRCLSVYLANSLPTVSLYLKLFRNCLLSCVNLLPSDSISLVTLETYSCHSYTLLGKLVIFTNIVHIFRVVSVRSNTCVDLTGRRVEIDQSMNPRLPKILGTSLD